MYTSYIIQYLILYNTVFKGFDMLIYLEGMWSWNVCGVNKKKGHTRLTPSTPPQKKSMDRYLYF